jgi:hypothetical protein
MRIRTASALACVLVAASDARADEKAECAAAHFEGQQHREAGRFGKARDRFLVCTNEGCPRVIQTECASFLSELDRVQPTMLIEARDPAGSREARVSSTGPSPSPSATGISSALSSRS